MKSRVSLTALAAAALAALLLYPGVYLLWGCPGTARDYWHHFAAARDFSQSLREGTLLPRWSASPNWGFGSPTFTFYPPLSYYLAALGCWLTGDVDRGFYLAAAVAALFGCISFHRLLRRDVSRRAALGATALYALLPYPILAFHENFAWGEFCALGWLPFVFLAARDAVETRRPSAVLRLVLGLAGLVATHLLTALILGPLLGSYLLHECGRRRSWSLVRSLAVQAALALAVAAGFLLPLALEHGLVHLEYVTSFRFGSFARNFPLADRGAAPPLLPADLAALRTIAVAQLLLLLGSAGARLFARSRAGPGALIGFSGLGLFYLMTPMSEPWWRAFPFFQTIQFPGRLCGPMGFLAAWLFGLALTTGPAGRGARVVRVVLLAGAALVCVSVTVSLLLGLQRAPDPGPSRSPGGALVVPEYLPKTADFEALNDYLPFRQDQPLSVLRGTARARAQRNEQHRRDLHVEVGPEGADVAFHLFAYPGWRLTLDGRELASRPLEPLGLLWASLPPGPHALALENRPTAARRAALWITLAGLLATMGFAFGYRPGPAAPPRPPDRRGSVLAHASIVGALGVLLGGLLLPSPRPRPNVVLVTGTALRADRAGFNGYPRPTTDRIEAFLLGRGVRCRDARTPVSDPVRAAERLFADSGLIGELREAGYQVAAFLGEDLLRSSAPLRAAFPEASVPEGERRDGAEVLARAAPWVRGHREEPFVLWVHLGDAGGMSGDRYDESLERVDRLAGRLVQMIDFQYLLDEAFVSVAGLSGLDLGEGPAPPDPGGPRETGVYLVFQLPGFRHRGAVIEDPVSVAQLAPTILEVALGRPGRESLLRRLEPVRAE